MIFLIPLAITLNADLTLWPFDPGFLMIRRIVISWWTLQWRHTRVIPSLITGHWNVCCNICLCWPQRKHQIPCYWPFEMKIHQWFSSQRASNAENLSMLSRHHGYLAAVDKKSYRSSFDISHVIPKVANMTKHIDRLKCWWNKVSFFKVF